MCTIATAKVQINYNCYNVYFYECLRISNATAKVRQKIASHKEKPLAGGILTTKDGL